jgi:hypothetical protein
MVNISFWYCESNMSKWLLQNGSWYFFVSIVFNSMIFGTIYWCCGGWTCLKTPKCSYMLVNWKFPMKVNEQYCLNFNVKLVKIFWSLVSLLMSCDKVKLFVILINIILMTFESMRYGSTSFIIIFSTTLALIKIYKVV